MPGSVTILYTGVLFLSASLLFVVQPMFAKMALPRLGGTPAVWNTCVVFFQLALLAGYAYTHFTVRWLGVRKQAVLHLLVLALPLLLLPIRLGADVQPPAAGNPAWWLLGVLAAVVGLPFFAVSTSAPLLQRWFSGTRHPHAADPYFLYAASNVGSLGALLLYPVAIEPSLRLADQSRIWSIAYGVFAIGVALCAIVMWRARPGTPGEGPSTVSESAPPGSREDAPSWRTRLLWVALAAVPSSLMLSVTTYTSTDIAAVPLLWVIPLALYLLTFVIVFARRQIISLEWLNGLLPVVVILPVMIMVMRSTPPLMGIPVHFLAFFAITLVCHGRLARLRPAAEHLTEFYVWMSVGGAVGGLFNTLVAPLLFVTTAEYPIGLVAACLLRMPTTRVEPDASTRTDPGWRLLLDVAPALAVIGLTWALLNLAAERDRTSTGNEWFELGRTYAIPLAVTLACWRRPRRFALALGAVLLVSHVLTWTRDPVLHAERTFFGQHQVFDRGTFRYLMHGTTNHGSQSHEESQRCEPTTYYSRTGPIGQLFGSFVGAHSKASIGSIGLGAGTMAAYARPGQSWTFFEINPAVVRIAQDGEYFTYLRDCIGPHEIVVGDARVSLGRAADGAFDVLVFDAFSSDAIPVHLMTLEALRLYLQKLAPGGVLAFHISNRYLDLGPVLGALAARLSLVGLTQTDVNASLDVRRRGWSASTWVVLARAPGDLEDLERDPRWSPLVRGSHAPVWTDDFSNILGIMEWR